MYVYNRSHVRLTDWHLIHEKGHAPLTEVNGVSDFIYEKGHAPLTENGVTV